MNVKIIAVFLAGALVGGGVFSLGRATAPGPEEPGPSPSVGPQDQVKIESLERRVEMLTQALDSMGRTVRLPAPGPKGAVALGKEATEERSPSQAEGVSSDPLAPRMLQLLEDDDSFREQMREIFRADRRERHEVNSAKRFARWMERLTTRLAEAEIEGLSGDQQADLEGILEEERRNVRAGFRRARRGELTWDEAREKAVNLRKANDEKVKPVLGDEQFTIFQEFRSRARGPH